MRKRKARPPESGYVYILAPPPHALANCRSIWATQPQSLPEGDNSSAGMSGIDRRNHRRHAAARSSIAAAAPARVAVRSKKLALAAPRSLLAPRTILDRLKPLHRRDRLQRHQHLQRLRATRICGVRSSRQPWRPPLRGLLHDINSKPACTAKTVANYWLCGCSFTTRACTTQSLMSVRHASPGSSHRNPIRLAPAKLA